MTQFSSLPTSACERRSRSQTGWAPDAVAGRGPRARLVANFVTTTACFLPALVVSRFFAACGLFPAPIWLPASVAVVAAMFGGVRLLPGIFPGSFLANDVLFAPPLYVTATVSTTNALGPMFGATALRRLQAAGRLFTSFRCAAAFLCCTTFLAQGVGTTVTIALPAWRVVSGP
jgi:integral membrane sensor domain MASE1